MFIHLILIELEQWGRQLMSLYCGPQLISKLANVIEYHINFLYCLILESFLICECGPKVHKGCRPLS
jgi:hypothetical protein